jgi:hypothetical protein
MWLFIVVVTAIVAVVAVVVVARLRKKRLQKRFRLQAINQGNVRSRYELRAEDPESALTFRFMLGGNSLPELGPAKAGTGSVQPAAPTPAEPLPGKKGGGVRKKAGQAVTASGAIAELLITLGTILPSSVGAPLFQKASQLRQGQIKASRVEQMPDRMTWLKPSAGQKAQDAVPRQAQDRAAQPPAAATASEAALPVPGRHRAGREQQAETAVQADGHIWVQTPFVQPGETLAIDLLIKAVTSDKSRHRLFRVFSCSVEQENGPLVVEECSVQIGGGFWTRRYLPYLIIAAAAIAILLLAFWLGSTGVLA